MRTWPSGVSNSYLVLHDLINLVAWRLRLKLLMQQEVVLEDNNCFFNIYFVK